MNCLNNSMKPYGDLLEEKKNRILGYKFRDKKKNIPNKKKLKISMKNVIKIIK